MNPNELVDEMMRKYQLHLREVQKRFNATLQHLTSALMKINRRRAMRFAICARVCVLGGRGGSECATDIRQHTSKHKRHQVRPKTLHCFRVCHLNRIY